MYLRIVGGVALAMLATTVFAEAPATKVVVGKAAPDIVMTGIDGEEMKLSDVTKQGKNVALMFSRAHW
ncbi:hypothetical protein [Planctomycetes bacterium K23_9]|uniref:Alkyl hydroperoxide reductase subunit C/ Thiol specific antioxidant domain-containing protein n=1 Tax=Stieleria marina TaxID=1930275 RepID=A0A517NZ63_9BACT|nr:hypothetical protein K239x_44320 [Planctomycetes bacterium K23_9]